MDICQVYLAPVDGYAPPTTLSESVEFLITPNGNKGCNSQNDLHRVIKYMKEQILKLKQEHPDWGYKKIAQLLDCSPNTIKYHLSSKERLRSKNHLLKSRKTHSKAIRVKYGGKCIICGYNKCLEALHFHHVNMEDKTNNVMTLVRTGRIPLAYKEAKKCLLLCANCHAEVHNGMATLTGVAPA